MIERYKDKKLADIFSDENKLRLWQDSELAMLLARVQIGEIDEKDYEEIKESLESHKIDINWWLQKDKEIHHDLNAFLEERIRFIPENLQFWFHKGLTSYDTEEPAFATMLKHATQVVKLRVIKLKKILKEMAKKHRYTVMMARTHGQEAEIQSFGKRCLSWLQDLQTDFLSLHAAELNLRYSKMSGAIGNYGSLDPKLEKKALNILGFEPYYGATQIVPRELFVPLAQSLSQIVSTLDKISVAIRLGARSGLKLYQEPFSKKQKGSSAMPHKKNTIRGEQQEGMDRMAKGYLRMIVDNIMTWEERAIEQSCVERVAWPDLFHVTVRSLDNMTRILGRLVVFPDNMLREIVNLKGCYASSHCKKFLKENGFEVEEAYRIVQLASFNAFDVPKKQKKQSFQYADEILSKERDLEKEKTVSIREIIQYGLLHHSPELDISKGKIKEWNNSLRELFSVSSRAQEWEKLFLPSYLLRNEKYLYEKILK
jgi:adenylosuccinate lyase